MLKRFMSKYVDNPTKTETVERKIIQGTNLELSKQELEFILVKLRSASYQGEEFEIFQAVWNKLAMQLK